MNTFTTQNSAWSIRKPAIIGLIALVILIGGGGIWSVATRLAGAVIATGVVEVQSQRQIVQHPEGGVVGQFMVRDGDPVKAGDILIQLDGTFMSSELTIVQNQLYELKARSARLIAERDGEDAVTIPDLSQNSDVISEEAQQIMEGQLSLFIARRDTMAQEIQKLRESIAQTHNQIDGTRAQLTSLGEQTILIESEISDQMILKEKGLSRESRIKSLEREASRLKGEIGRLQAELARLSNQTTTFEVDILRLKTTRREEAITELRDIRAQEIELQERKLSLQEQLSRLEIRAPVSGTVYDSQIFAIGAVVQPAQPIMYVIPQAEPLVITVRVPPIHVDQLYVDQPVSLKFPAFSQNQTPNLSGRVTKISADVHTDEHTGQSYYKVTVKLDPNQIELLNGGELVPGMPVEAFIKTQERTPLSYLVKPLTDYFTRAFRQ